MVNIFITGATGYIGGDTLYELYNKHPEYSYTALVRTAEKGKSVTDKFPKVKTVQGDNDSSDLLKEEASKADIVIHTADASDHEGAAKAIAEGLASGHNASKPGYWLHTGGTGILTYFDSSADKFGEHTDKVFDDLDGVAELINLPQEAFHKNVDQIVINAGTNASGAVKTAIVCPPTIYGDGRGPSLTRGRQVYELAKSVLEIQAAPIIGGGKAMWNNVHVHDLARAFVLLVEEAAKNNTDPKLWGQNGYYFTENGEHVWGDLSKVVAEAAKQQGLIKEVKSEQMDMETAKKTAGFEAVSWGWNSRGKARRFKELLGWKPQEQSIENEVPTIVKNEHERLQQEKK
ncbi:NAD(P)-binding protein [Aureobasidium sp. EXF-3400]|nr:NAD(P)-binding protein [Aureobasidium sp. EXF-12344]KAI4776301.1 NAD(P)-binding protein [Aureobasidium sp. EXF-3400]